MVLDSVRSVLLQNVVVVNQPATRPTPIVAPMAPRAPDYFNFSVCTLVFCILCGGIPFVICAIVALVFSIKVRRGSGEEGVCVGGGGGAVLLRCVVAGLSRASQSWRSEHLYGLLIVLGWVASCAFIRSLRNLLPFGYILILVSLASHPPKESISVLSGPCGWLG